MSVFNKNTSVPRCHTAAENGVMTKGVVSGGGGIDLRLRRVTSSPSQTFRRRLVRTTDAAVSADTPWTVQSLLVAQC